MEKLEKGHELSQSPDFVAQNIELLKSLFPQLNKEGKIDKQELLALLGDYTETDEEFYRFTWAGKSMARREANKPSTATLLPDKESSKEWDTTQNVFIEGDNLEVLKLLQKGYANKIKMIYIDPPYNTGKDFVYKDNYSDNLNNYLAITGQLGEDGKRISTNSESNGRYHSNWLNMMYPRLKLARNLLKEDGVIFISIDEKEFSNLQKLVSELFGEENYLGEIVWETATDNNASQVSMEHEYILCYSKLKTQQDKWQIKSNKADFIIQKYNEFRKVESSITSIQEKLRRWINAQKKTNELDLSGISHYSYVDEKGVYYPGNPNNTKPGGYNYEVLHPITKLPVKKPSNGWRFPETTFWKANESGDVEWGENENTIPKIKKRIDTATELLKSYYYEDNRVSTNFLSALFDNKKIFENPKSSKLISRIAQFVTKENDIILDFFAGSGTTADAVMQLNAEDGGERKFICVQLPEPTDEKSEAYKAGYKTISEITKERIRRAGEKIKAELKEDLFTDQGKTLDIGFKAFKLDSSNIRAWDGNPEALEENLFTAENNIKENRTEEDVLYEILLKYGLDLTIPYEEKTLEGQRVFNLGMGALFVCLGTKITTEVAEGIGQWYEELQVERTKVILRDNGFTDVAKTNSMKILERYGIKEVSTI